MALIDEARLIQIPSGYKAGTLYSVLPDSSDGDFDVARNSVATRVNSDIKLEEMAVHVPRISYDSGVTCPYCLLEPQRTNLLTYPVSFGNSYWTKSGATIEASSVTGSELITNSDMELNSDWTQEGSTVSCAQSNEQAHSGTYSWKIVTNSTSEGVKQSAGLALTIGTTYKISVWVYHAFGSDQWFTFRSDDSVGLPNQLNNVVPTGTWTELTYTFTCTASTTVVYKVFSSVASDADLTFYVDDYSIKEAVGFSAPHADSPLDVSAFKLVEDSATSEHYVLKGSVPVTNGATVSLSVYAKQAERTWLRVENLSASDGYYFDLANGVVGTEIGTVDDVSITAMANGWYRCVVVATVPSTICTIQISLADADNSSSYAGDGSSGAYIAFSQMEEGAYPTSFAYSIAGGEGSTTTRIADECNNAGVAATFNSVEGVLYAEIAALSNDGTFRYISLSDGTTNNRVNILYPDNTNYIRVIIKVGGVSVIDGSYTSAVVTDFHKIAVRWKLNSFQLYVDGVERVTDASGVSFAADVLTTLQFDQGGGASDFYGKCREISVFEYLTDAQMITLTT